MGIKFQIYSVAVKQCIEREGPCLTISDFTCSFNTAGYSNNNHTINFNTDENINTIELSPGKIVLMEDAEWLAIKKLISDGVK